MMQVRPKSNRKGKKCKECGCQISNQNKTGYCKKCFGRFVLSPAGAAATRIVPDASITGKVVSNGSK
jgi:hypothetical protein